MKIGISYRPTLHREIIDKVVDMVDVIEVMPDIMSTDELIALNKYSKEVSFGLHSLRTSLGSSEGVQTENDRYYYLTGKFFETEYYSDHIAYSYLDNRYLTTVKNIEYNNSTLKVVINNLREINKHYKSGEYLIENVVNHSKMLESTMSESDFFKRVCDDLPNIGVLFDLTNAIVSANHFNMNLSEYLVGFPFDKIKVIHVSGYENINNRYQDTHAVSINQDTIEELKRIIKLSNADCVIIERDFNPNDDDLIVELENIKAGIN
ncbi:MAG: DUF692 domain-containing protein [Lactobacillaceae bacterium]|jgi:uncharacterized protein (UPF0276 family)|nr:DUF692 domain-containing protein [Lactobacillaceae bacterium]